MVVLLLNHNPRVPLSTAESIPVQPDGSDVSVAREYGVIGTLRVFDVAVMEAASDVCRFAY
jgi:hypothetical protein